MKFSNLQDYISDPDKEKNGIDIDLGAKRSLTIRRAGGGTNREYDAAFVEEVLQFKERYPEKEIDDEVTFALSKNIFAKSVIIGWKGILDDNGKDIPFTHENALELLKQSNELTQRVMNEASNQANFRAKEIDSSGKK